MFCTKCGKKCDDNAKFCTFCGAPILSKNEYDGGKTEGTDYKKFEYDENYNDENVQSGYAYNISDDEAQKQKNKSLNTVIIVLSIILGIVVILLVGIFGLYISGVLDDIPVISSMLYKDDDKLADEEQTSEETSVETTVETTIETTTEEAVEYDYDGSDNNAYADNDTNSNDSYDYDSGYDYDSDYDYDGYDSTEPVFDAFTGAQTMLNEFYSYAWVNTTNNHDSSYVAQYTEQGSSAFQRLGIDYWQERPDVKFNYIDNVKLVSLQKQDDGTYNAYVAYEYELYHTDTGQTVSRVEIAIDTLVLQGNKFYMRRHKWNDDFPVGTNVDISMFN